MGLKANDIDLVMENITGEELVNFLKNEFGENFKLYKISPKKEDGINIIKINLFGHNVDLVELANVLFINITTFRLNSKMIKQEEI